MRRLWWLGLAVSVAWLTGTAAPALAAPAGPDITCSGGYRELVNDSGNGYAIVGHGSGQYVSLTTRAGGSCWANVEQGTNVFQLENENGKCLNAVRSSSQYQVDEATSCDPSSTQQLWAQFACDGSTVFGNLYTSDYLVASVNNGAPVYADSSATCLPITLWSA